MILALKEVWRCHAALFRHLMNYPGEQLPFERPDNLAAPVMIIAMQVAYSIACDAFRFPLSAPIRS